MTVKNLSDLRDSKILYDKNPPAFGYALILIVTVTMGALIAWSLKAPKVYICQASGTVQSANKNYIMSSYTGAITEIYISEGTRVNEGDLVAQIKTTDIDLQRQQLEGQLAIYQAQIDQYNKLIRSIRDNVNYFSESNTDDRAFYYQYETYKSQIAQTQFDPSTYEAYGYSDAQIQALIEQNQGRVQQVYYSALQSASEQVANCQSNISNIQAQIDALDNGAKAYSIYAPTSGTVHMDNAYKQGMVIGAGSVLASIASEQDDYNIIAYVSLSDRPLIHEGDHCTIALSGLSQTVYGTLSGTVSSIDSDYTASESSAVYKISVTPDSHYLISKNGDKVNLSNGMSVTARIEYDKITYFQYVMEALGVLTR